MCAPRVARAKSEFGGVDRFDFEEFEAHDSADDIDDGIYCAHFVEVDRFNGGAVDFCFGFGEFLKDARGFFFCRGRYRAAVDDFKYVFQVPVDVAFPGVDVYFGAGNTVFFHATLGEGEFAHAEFIEFGFQDGKRQARIDERAEGHVAADAGKAVEIGDFHKIILKKRP